MNRETAIRKVRACLRLSKSANPHEAARAMRQAQALMREHGLSEHDVETDPIESATTRTRHQSRNVPVHVLMLANVIAHAMTCEALFGDERDVVFFGQGANPQIAGFTFDVLRRQMERQASAHVSRVRKASVRRERTAAFGIGWVQAILEAYDSMPALPPGLSARIETHVRERFGRPSKSVKKEPARIRASDHAAGWIAGKRAKVNPGVGGSGPARLGHH